MLLHMAILYERPSAYNIRNVAPEGLCRLKEDLQRLPALPEFKSYLGAEVLKILKLAVNYFFFLQEIYLKLQRRECDTTGPL